MLSRTSRIIGLCIAGAMFLFSAGVYVKTGDWVAAVFAAGALAYGVFFFSTAGGDR
jgi:hypothetical protein